MPGKNIVPLLSLEISVVRPGFEKYKDIILHTVFVRSQLFRQFGVEFWVGRPFSALSQSGKAGKDYNRCNDKQVFEYFHSFHFTHDRSGML